MESFEGNDHPSIIMLPKAWQALIEGNNQLTSINQTCDVLEPKTRTYDNIKLIWYLFR